MKRTFATIFVLLLVTLPARAATVQWNLDNVVNGYFGGGYETITGFFDYNTASNSITYWNLQAIGGTVSTFTGVSGSIGGPAFVENLGPPSDPSFSGSFGNYSNPDPLALTFGTGNLDGTSNLLFVGGLYYSPSVFVGGPDSAPPSGFITVNGSLDYGGEVSPVPLPAALPLFGSGVIALTGLAWRWGGKVS
jgi:hypothetical protein